MSIITPSIYTVISKSNPTGVYSRLPNSYIDNLVLSPTNRPPNPSKGLICTPILALALALALDL